MKNWQNNRSYRKYKNPDGSFTYTITVDGEEIVVNAEVYRVYAETERKMEYMELDLKRDRVLQDANGKAVKDENGRSIVLPEREISLDKLVDEDWDYPSSEPSPEEIVIGQLEISALYSCLDLLEADEWSLIDALFFDGLTEREYSAKTGIPQMTINDRKHRIFNKLKQLLQE